MSIQFRIIKLCFKLMGVKKMSFLPQSKLIIKSKKLNRNRGFKIPKRKGMHYSDKIILKQYHCLKITTHSTSSKRAVLYLFGGGYVLGPDDKDVQTAENIGKNSERDVWFPYYPLCIDSDVKVSYEMVYAVYKEMLKEYKPEDIAVLGFSSGGALAIGMCLHNNEQPHPLPMPGLLIAVSPGCVPVTVNEKCEMKELSKKDILMDFALMSTIQSIMEHGTDVPEYMISAICGNFTNVPMTHFYYGSDEVLYAEAPYFIKAYEKYHAPYQMHVKKGMCHCYPSITLYPEGKQAQHEIIQILRN